MGTAEKIIELLAEYPEKANYYCTYEPKKDGGRRPIVKPDKELNKWLREINKALRQQFNSWPSHMHGGIKKRSYVSFVKPHIAKNIVVTIDIKDCFGSITNKEVADALVKWLKLSKPVCDSLAARLCHKGKVPQGFATSNYLSNLYLLPIMLLLNRELRRKGVTMTNYVETLLYLRKKWTLLKLLIS